MATAPTDLPFEYQTGLEKAQRQRKLAELMLAQGMQPTPRGQMVGQYFAPTNALQYLAQGLQQYAGRTGMVEADQSEQAVKQRYATDLAEAMANFQKGTPRERITTGQTSKFAQIQKLAADLAKRQDERFGIAAKHADPVSVVGAVQRDAGAESLIPYVGKDPEVGTIRGSDGKTLPFLRTFNKDGSVDAKGLPQPTNVHLDARQAAARDNTYTSGIAKSIEKTYEDARMIPQSLTRIEQAVGELDRGTKSGLGADVVAAIQNVGRFFNVDLGNPAGLENLKSQLSGLTFDTIGGLGAQISDADRRFVAQLTGSSLQDPATLRRLLAIAAGAQLQRIHQHNSRVMREAEAMEKDQPGLGERISNAFQVPFELRVNPDMSTMVDRVRRGQPAGDYSGSGAGSIALPPTPPTPPTDAGVIRQKWKPGAR